MAMLVGSSHFPTLSEKSFVTVDMVFWFGYFPTLSKKSLVTVKCGHLVLWFTSIVQKGLDNMLLQSFGHVNSLCHQKMS